MKNSELIARPNGDHLDGLDRQRRYVLLRHNVKKGCPNCATQLNVFEAAGVDVDDYDVNSGKEPPFSCPACRRELRFILPLFGGDWHWALVPVDLRASAQ